MALVWGASIPEIQVIFVDGYGKFLPDGITVSVYPENLLILPQNVIDFSILGAYPSATNHGQATFYGLVENTTYQIVFSGTGAPVGTYTLNVGSLSLFTVTIGVAVYYTSSKTDFVSTINITNPSLITADMISDLPDNYTNSQNSNIFALSYGTGYEFERLKQTLLQLEANNYLYSPDIQTQSLAIDGVGLYRVELPVQIILTYS
jgi:hypothetical protein